MDYYASLILEAGEFLKIFMNSSTTDDELLDFIEEFGYPGAYVCPYAPACITNLVFLHGDDFESYSLDEIAFMDNGSSAVMAIDIQKNKNSLSFWIVELQCQEEERNLVACALVKILNKAFKNNNIIIFRYNHEISFGCHLYIAGHKHDDFCISKWFSVNNSLCAIELFFYDSVMGESFEETYKNFSANVMSYTPIVYSPLNYDQLRPKPEYLDILHDISEDYNLDLRNEIQSFRDSLFEKPVLIDAYRDISNQLKSITSENLTSYEYLELAELAEKKFAKVVSEKDTDIYEIDVVTAKRIENLSSDAFSDAQKMLEYLNLGL